MPCPRSAACTPAPALARTNGAADTGNARPRSRKPASRCSRQAVSSLARNADSAAAPAIATIAAIAGDETDHGACSAASPAITAGSPIAYPARMPGIDQCLVRLRSTSTPGSPASVSGSPGTASRNASSTTTSRPGRTSERITAAGCSTPVGLTGLPTTTRSASAGTAAGWSRKPSSARHSATVT